MIKKQEILLNELPSYSRWIPYLLGLAKFEKSLEKSAENISREFNIEKWGEVLNLLRSKNGVSLSDVDSLFIKDVQQAYYANGKLQVDSSLAVHREYFEILVSELTPEIEKSNHIVELGAGYGALIFKMAQLNEMKHVSFSAGEYTQSGIECIKLLAGDNLRVKGGYCDLGGLDLKALSPPENSVYFTSWSMVYTKGFPERTMRELLAYKPSMVMHFEPVREHWTGDSMLEMLWKRYLQLNDYNQSMLTGLRQYEQMGLIRIVEEKKNLHGINPLMPVSVLKWVPCT